MAKSEIGQILNPRMVDARLVFCTVDLGKIAKFVGGSARPVLCAAGFALNQDFQIDDAGVGTPKKRRNANMARASIKTFFSGLAGLAVSLSVFASILSVSKETSAETLPSWDETLEIARGQEVFWNAWGGSDVNNNFIKWASDRIEEEYGVIVTHVKVQDAAQSVRRVLAEKQAGRTSNGSVDLIWINGENFKMMKDNDLLFGPITPRLPNFGLIDTVENPTTTIDFTVPTEGLESPWGFAKLVFIHDSETLPEPPRSIHEIMEYAKANPGRITYPAPPDFTGTTFLKQVLYANIDDPEMLLRPVDENYDEATVALWNFLDTIDPYLWRRGRDYPKNGVALRQLLDDGEIDLAFSFNIGEASSAVAKSLLPETARTYVLDNGTIGNTHFVAIPFNAKNKEGAMVVADFLLSPEAQARKANPSIWGEATVLSMSRLSPEQRALFDAIELGDSSLTPDKLGITLPEPHPSWMTKIEETWLARFGN